MKICSRTTDYYILKSKYKIAITLNTSLLISNIFMSSSTDYMFSHCPESNKMNHLTVIIIMTDDNQRLGRNIKE